MGRMGKAKWRVIVVTAVGAALLMSNPASSHVMGHRDPDDVDHKLDIKTARIERSDGQFTFTMRTHDRFSQKRLMGSGFTVFVDSFGDGAFDFRVELGLYVELGSWPYCSVYDREGFNRAGADAEKGPRSLSCRIPRDVFEPTKHIRWRTKSYAHSQFLDRAPDRGWFRH